MFKRILVHLDDTLDCEMRLKAAKVFANKFDSKVSGIVFSDDLKLVPSAKVRKQNPNELEDANVIDSTVNYKANFSAIRERLNVHSALEEIDWSVVSRPSTAAIGSECFFQDLIVMSTDVHLNELLDKLDSTISALAAVSGGPLYALPAKCDALHKVDSPLIIWNATKACARAISDSLPFLQSSEQITVLLLTKHLDDVFRERSVKNLLSYFEANEISKDRVNVLTQVMSDVELSDIVEKNGHDLIIVGAYDHSHVKEVFAAGALSIIVKKASVPILISH